ncbi:MAG: lipid-binding SYLF domain-containing protein [Alphaproteobacteria bacterium]|nr:lipid-binding SYLF domain-containing protein [Alphaproteobacteria bacterium]
MATAGRWLIGLTLLSIIGLGGCAGPSSEAASASRSERLVEESRLVLRDFLDDEQYQRMRVYVQNAYAIIVMPDLLKGGFLAGAESGTAIMLVRNPTTGGWGQPAFYDVYGGSLGLQFGVQTSDVVLTIMNEGAVKQMVGSGFKIGADASVAAGRVGSTIGAATTTRFGEDLYVFARSQGLFGGFAIDGSYIAAKDDWNAAYYGRPVQPWEVMSDFNVISGTEVASLHDALTSF